MAYTPMNDEDEQNEDDEPEKDEYGNIKVRDIPKREITFEEAVAFGKKLGAVHYIETSAKTGYHVDSMIGKMVRHLLNAKYSEEQKKRKKKSTSSANKKWWTKCTVL